MLGNVSVCVVLCEDEKVRVVAAVIPLRLNARTFDAVVALTIVIASVKVVAPVIVAAEIEGLVPNTTLPEPVVPVMVVAPMTLVPPVEMVLLVSVSVVALPTNVSVALGAVIVPVELKLNVPAPLTKLVAVLPDRVLLVSVCVNTCVTKVSPPVMLGIERVCVVLCDDDKVSVVAAVIPVRLNAKTLLGVAAFTTV